MRKIKEVLRLRNELKLEQRQIARSCSISVSTVHEYLKRAAAANLGWPLADGWDDARLEAALFPCPDASPQPPTKKSPPDFAAIHEQLQRHRHVTLQLVWDEYRDANQDGYGYSRFCELYQRWRKAKWQQASIPSMTGCPRFSFGAQGYTPRISTRRIPSARCRASSIRCDRWRELPLNNRSAPITSRRRSPITRSMRTGPLSMKRALRNCSCVRNKSMPCSTSTRASSR